MMTEAVRTSETSVFSNKTSWRYTSEGCDHLIFILPSIITPLPTSTPPFEPLVGLPFTFALQVW
jgi:hypothetical protein